MLASSPGSPAVYDLHQVARLPALGDNCAIAVRRLPKETRVLIHHLVFQLSSTVLEGHRFAVHRINKGENLLSWGLPFGAALRPIEPGEYLCNEKVLGALRHRQLDFELPSSPNFADFRPEFDFGAAGFVSGQHPPAEASPRSFNGFRRPGGRGVGTRNYLVVLGTSSRAGAFARRLADQFKDAGLPHVHGVVGISHTEGGGETRPLNEELILRTLAGFMVHPNVAAVLVVDQGSEPVNNEILRTWIKANSCSIESVPHAFLSIGNSFEKALHAGHKLIAQWLSEAALATPEPCPVSALKIGLQCGGSDAFSGVSANPLVGILSRKTVALGGSANLAETSELIGAEAYVLANVREAKTAERFLAIQKRFEEWAALHGHSAEGNPSGGNLYRGLYNITIKSIGAARKKDPATSLDFAIDYAAPMTEPGFYFMDSPGNDLESIAGQVAAGCNMILFTTGNGSITNFPFVPTLKFMTTTSRFELVRNEMDFNAGRYLEGEPLEQLGEEAFELMLQTASGKKSAGEKAGHAQVQLWRDWRGGPAAAAPLPILPATLCQPEVVPAAEAHAALGAAPIRERVALILPTSLCSGEVSRLIAQRLNRALPHGFTRAATLPHTEGCGNSPGQAEAMFMRTLASYLAHPNVAAALLLEHGCEKTHNDAFRHVLTDSGMAPENFGWASVQLDGGIDRVLAKAVGWFESRRAPRATQMPFSLGFAGAPSAATLGVFHALAAALVEQGGASVFSEGLHRPEFPQLQYGERFASSGCFVMGTPTTDATEIISGLAATGVQCIIAVGATLLPANPIVPVLQVTEINSSSSGATDTDLLVDPGEPVQAVRLLLNAIHRLRAGELIPKNQQLQNISFQVTRGNTGISL